jgi:RNA polymerase sigma-70 factor (ECF subfamily)
MRHHDFRDGRPIALQAIAKSSKKFPLFLITSAAAIPDRFPMDARTDPHNPPEQTGAIRDGESTIRLLERAREGDRQALEILFARCVPLLRRWAQGRLPRWARDAADTQDLVQETVLQTFKRLNTFEPRREGALQAYLRQALMNRIRDELRRFERRPVSSDLDASAPDTAPSPLEAAIGQQAYERYERALGRLRPEDREAIIARVELGYSYEELASALDKPTPEAARKAAQRALLRLAAEMKHDA